MADLEPFVPVEEFEESEDSAEPEKSAKPEKPAKTCYQRAVDLLSRRAHFQAELRFKLRQRGFDDAQIDGALGRLSEEGYVDDLATAELWVEQQLARKPQGSARLLSGLLRRGVDRDVARDTLQRHVEPREEELALAAAERWQVKAVRMEKAVLSRHLNRLGFRAGTIFGVVRRLGL